jgi:hypothetical protein
MAQGTQAGGFMRSVRRWLGRAGPPAARASVAAERPASSSESDSRLRLMLTEWQEVRESLRFCDRQRLIQLAVFVFACVLIAIVYLPIAGVLDPRWGPARWALPSLGAILSLVFLALEAGALAYRSEWARRGRQIEAAVQVLSPGIGPVSSLALLSQFDPGVSGRARLASAAIGALYGLALLAWAAALLAMLLARA